MSRPVPRLAIETDHEVLSGYAGFCAALGVTDRALRDRLRSARAFLGAHPDLDAWLARPLPTRLADLRRIQAWPLLSYLALEGTVRLDVDLLLAKNQGGFGLTAERYWAADFERAREGATRLDWAPNWTRDVVRECMPLVLAWSGKRLGELGEADLDGFRTAVEASPAATRWARRSYNARLFSIRALLFELGNLAAPPRRAYRAATLTERFAVVPAPEIRRAMLAYVDARSAVLARSSLEGLANDLILFGEYLDAHHPEVGSLRALERRHVRASWSGTGPALARPPCPPKVGVDLGRP